MKFETWIKKSVEDVIYNDTFDMMDVLTKEQVETMVYDSIEGLKKDANINIYYAIDEEGTDGYYLRVNNTVKSFVSLSDTEGTGVSRSEYFLFKDAEHPSYDEIKNFVEMINEAWYLCSN